MTAFADALLVLHADENVAVDARLEPVIGITVDLLVANGHGVVLSAGNPAQNAFETGYRRSKIGVSVPRAALSKKPVDGDRLIVGDRTFIVRAADPDAEELSWQLDVDEQT